MKKICLLFCFLLTACSTMKPEECRNANWKDIGYNDAIQGRTVWLKSRIQACAKVKIAPDRKAYLLGYQAGSMKFCTFKNGFVLGRSGNERTNICATPTLSKPFSEGYEQGFEMFKEEEDLRERLYELQMRLHHLSHSHRNNE